jgi:hypothetical protein
MVVKPQVAIVQIGYLQCLALASGGCPRDLCNMRGCLQQVSRTYYQSLDAYTCSRLKTLVPELVLLPFSLV